MRHLSKIDQLLSSGARLPGLLHEVGGPAAFGQEAGGERALVSKVQSQSTLTEVERKLSGGLMRVNHVGEVCAQALYEAQASVTKSPELREQLLRAAHDERRHLVWVQSRLDQLGAKPSTLNPVWFAGAYGLGLLAGLAGDRISLGFVAETEKQVEAHLAGHLSRLPATDIDSRQIVEAMRLEEEAHGKWAMNHGGVALFWPVRLAMRLSAKLMTSVARYI